MSRRRVAFEPGSAITPRAYAAAPTVYHLVPTISTGAQRRTILRPGSKSISTGWRRPPTNPVTLQVAVMNAAAGRLEVAAYDREPNAPRAVRKLGPTAIEAGKAALSRAD